jgi:hypothetical protein
LKSTSTTAQLPKKALLLARVILLNRLLAAMKATAHTFTSTPSDEGDAFL